MEIKSCVVDENVSFSGFSGKIGGAIFKNICCAKGNMYIKGSITIGGKDSTTGGVIINQGCVNLTIIGHVKESARISSGDNVTIEGNVEKKALVKTSMGGIKAPNIHEATLKAYKDIIIGAIVSDNSILESSMGKIKVTSVGKVVNVSVDNINFTAEDDIEIIDGIIGGNSTLKSSMGGIKAPNIHGAKLTAYEDIIISGTVSNGSELKSSMHGIKATNVDGSTLTAYENIIVSDTVSGSSKLESSMHGIKVDTAYKGAEFKAYREIEIENDLRGQGHSHGSTSRSQRTLSSSSSSFSSSLDSSGFNNLPNSISSQVDAVVSTALAKAERKISEAMRRFR